MTDQFGREINYARISVTDRCNLRCRYCMPECGVKKIPHAQILTLEEILRVAEIFSRLGIKKIRITGGEPLLRKNLPELIKKIKNLRGIEQVTLTTNGVLLKNFYKELIAAGLDGINLSLDTFDEKIFSDLTRRKFLPKVLENFQLLIAENFPVKINCVPLRGVNDAEILRLAELAKNNFIKVRFIELMPIGCAENSGLKGVSTSEIISLLENNFGELIPVRQKNSLQGPAQYFSIKNFKGQIGFIDAMEHKFCASCNRIRLTAEGFLKTCLSFDAGLDIKNLLRCGGSNDEFLERIRETIYRKPLEHKWQCVMRNAQCVMDWRHMYQIGG